MLPTYSGIVVSGFGDAEVFPQLEEYVIDIRVCGKVRHWKKTSWVLDEDHPSQVVPLADSEVMKTLIEGISPGFEGEAYTGVLKLILEMPQKILDPITQLSDAEKQQYIADARKSLPQHFRDFRNVMTEYRNKTYTKPISDSISSLPISELAQVAETLLGASQLLKKVNPDLETVGGPVDVAVISKGDGFVWVKRKHYFPKDLNIGFEKRYLDI
jgi:hypothetical protein